MIKVEPAWQNSSLATFCELKSEKCGGRASEVILCIRTLACGRMELVKILRLSIGTSMPAVISVRQVYLMIFIQITYCM